MTKPIAKLFSAALLCAAFVTTACVADEATTGQEPARDKQGTVEAPAPKLSTSQSQLITCTPSAKMCDFGCYYVGGPSSDDCIVKCNASGTGYTLYQSCGWAQNFPYSSSCLDRPNNNPICQNN